MNNLWQSLLFETCEGGVSSALAPELLRDNQLAWGFNADLRGGKAATRPGMRLRLVLPPGLIQGAEFFGVQGGMIVASIAGYPYKIRVNGRNFSYEPIPLAFYNSGILKQVWMTQTVETLVIQDGQSDPILYNGSSATRSNPATGGVPRGRQMAYGNGRLWVAVNANEIVAGDIRTGVAGSELLFTEATYLQGGGKLFFSSALTGLAFIPVTGQSDYGALLVFGAQESNAVRADITSRDDWGLVPGFVTSLLRSVGASSAWSIVSVNQDLYWRDSNGGIRSIRNALADEAGPGSAPVSREVSRLTDYDSPQLLPWCSGVYFDNRLLMTSSPFLLDNGGRAWRDLISLDFAPLSSMAGKSGAAYNGQWTGLNFVKLVGGLFGGKNRAFALVTDDDGINSLWEFENGNQRRDMTLDCSDGTADAPQRITSYIEFPRRNFGNSKRRKLLSRCDVWLSDVAGELGLKVYWRADNWQKWLLWDEAETCAKVTDAATTAPHVWKNLRNQDRPQFKTFTIPDNINELVGYSASVGFEFQVRLVWEGQCRIHRVMLHGQFCDDPDFADRTGFEVTCVENDITGNQVNYEVRTNCDDCVLTFEAQPENVTSDTGGTADFSVTVDTENPDATYQWQQSLNDGTAWADLDDGEHVAGATTAELSLTDLPEEWDGSLYRVNVTLPGCVPGGGGLDFTSDQAAVSYGVPLAASLACLSTEYDYSALATALNGVSFPATNEILAGLMTVNQNGLWTASGTWEKSCGATTDGGMAIGVMNVSFYALATSQLSNGSPPGSYTLPTSGSVVDDIFANGFNLYKRTSSGCASTTDYEIGTFPPTTSAGEQCRAQNDRRFGSLLITRSVMPRAYCIGLTIGHEYRVTFTIADFLGALPDQQVDFTATDIAEYVEGTAELIATGEIWVEATGVTIEDITPPPEECPTIEFQPENASTAEGVPAMFSVFILAAPSATYQWQVNDGGGWDNTTDGPTYTGSETPGLGVMPTLAMDGYQYRLVTSQPDCIDVTSDVATLTVTP